MKIIYTVFLLLVFCNSSIAANYSLEIIQPQPGLSTANRYYKAYPDREYKVRIGAIGGLYPYTYAIVEPTTTCNNTNAVTLDSSTGILTWTPQVGDSGCTMSVSVTDTESTTVTREWAITVSTTGVYFLDSVGGLTVAEGGLGTLASPWKTIDDLLEAGTVSADTMAYFKTGTYNLDNLTLDLHGEYPNGYGYAKDISSGDNKPVIWLAYPGDTPTIDFGSSGWEDQAPHFKIIDNDLYISGFTLTNCWNFCFQGLMDRSVFSWNTFTNLRNGQDGANSAFVMSSGSGVGQRHYSYYHDNSFANVFINTDHPGGAFLKFYSETKSLFEQNTLSNENGSNTTSQEGLSWKGYNTYSVTRLNSINYITDHAIGGSADQNDEQTVEFNLVRNCGTGDGVVVSERGTQSVEYHYRNTYMCPVKIGGMASPYTSATDNFRFTDNVIQNANATYDNIGGLAVYPGATVDWDGVTQVGDLYAASGIVDTDGNLQGEFRTTYLGTKGYELATSSTPPSAQGCTISGGTFK